MSKSLKPKWDQSLSEDWFTQFSASTVLSFNGENDHKSLSVINTRAVEILLINSIDSIYAIALFKFTNLRKKEAAKILNQEQNLNPIFLN